jgi:hypothetical protein
MFFSSAYCCLSNTNLSFFSSVVFSAILRVHRAMSPQIIHEQEGRHLTRENGLRLLYQLPQGGTGYTVHFEWF